MKNVKEIVTTKRKRLQSARGMNRVENSKFVTKIQRTNESNNDEDEKKNIESTEMQPKKSGSGTYSFGLQYYYWDFHKKLAETDKIVKRGAVQELGRNIKYSSLYVAAKYKDLKDEVLNNKTCNINLNGFLQLRMNAALQIKSRKCRRIKANSMSPRNLLENYGIDKGSKIKEEHLLSVLLYTNFDTLSYQFSCTFRKMSLNETIESCRDRNKEFAIWSRLLIETVELFGTMMGGIFSNNKLQTFYHGISAPLVFSGFLTFFSSPTSTSTQLPVAAIFANNDGIVLELGKYEDHVTFFDCTWLSCFSNEDERLFIHGDNYLKIDSIRSMAENIDYRVFINVLMIFDAAISGHTQKFGLKGFKVTKKDVRILRRLIEHIDDKIEYKNKFPKYINDMFYTLVMNKKWIKINLTDINSDRVLMKPLLCHNTNNLLLKYDYLLRLFSNCTMIISHYRHNEKPIMNDEYLNTILSELEKINKLNHMTFEFEYIRFDDEMFKKYECLFKTKGWNLSLEDFNSGQEFAKLVIDNAKKHK